MNTATDGAFAAGIQAKAIHTGAFVWSDGSSVSDLNSSTNHEFTARASGGVRFFTDADATAGVFIIPGGTSWGVISDRNAKKNFTPVDSREVLEKLAALPITQWHYRWEDGSATPHIGPVAQDFKAAFYPGRDDKSITTQEADGVALAAIQGLNEKVEQREAAMRRELKDKEAEIVELKRSVAKLGELIYQLAAERQRNTR
jgi:hypothetical protein